MQIACSSKNSHGKLRPNWNGLKRKRMKRRKKNKEKETEEQLIGNDHRHRLRDSHEYTYSGNRIDWRKVIKHICQSGGKKAKIDIGMHWMVQCWKEIWQWSIFYDKWKPIGSRNIIIIIIIKGFRFECVCVFVFLFTNSIGNKIIWYLNVVNLLVVFVRCLPSSSASAFISRVGFCVND